MSFGFNSFEQANHLEYEDPLYHFLKSDIMPSMGHYSPDAHFHVYKLGGSNEVYLYEDILSGARFVGKFFLPLNGEDWNKGKRRGIQEFDNLCLLRSIGLENNPHYVVRPLSFNPWINNLLLMEHCDGELLSDIINNALYTGNEGYLFEKLTALAYFLATLHNRTAIHYSIDFNKECNYMDDIVKKLYHNNEINSDEIMDLKYLQEIWREKTEMWQDVQVMVHGDATPGNFIFGPGLNVTAIDFERLKFSDRIYDVGRIAGELQHFYIKETGNKFAAEPCINHFLKEYSSHFPDSFLAFLSITKRVPFYMGVTLLRIARNSWLPQVHRQILIEEGKNLLRSF